MRRTGTAVLASAMMALALPAAAAAHHRHHHARAHKHASSARILRFGALSAATAPSTPSTPATTPSSPSTEPAGTVLTFDKEKGVLTIELADKKTTVSGKVTEETELRCQSSTPSPEGDDEQEGSDDEAVQEGDEHGTSHDSGQLGQHGDSFAHSANAQDEGGGQGQEPCTTAVLTPGAVVLGAELKLTPAGAVWEKVDLIH
jgi:hypothetical protein